MKRLAAVTATCFAALLAGGAMSLALANAQTPGAATKVRVNAERPLVSPSAVGAQRP